MKILIQLLISHFILGLIGIIVFFWILKAGVKKFLNKNIDYLAILKWFVNIVKSIFSVWR